MNGRPLAQPATRAAAIPLVAAVIIAAAGGYSVAQGHGPAAIALGIGALALALLPRLLPRTIGRDYVYVELPIILLLLSTIVLRQRSTESLGENPVDTAALYRLACVAAAGLLSLSALLSRRSAGNDVVRTPGAVKVYFAYVVVVLLGAPLSVNPFLTAYRGVELAVGLLVVFTATQLVGGVAVHRLERVLYVATVLLVSSVWVGALLWPAEAIATNVAPLPFQLQGLYPQISSNGVGELGALLLLWSLGILVSGRAGERRRAYAAMVALGAVTLLGGQYRTGYIAVAVALSLLLVTRGRIVLAIALLSALMVVSVWSTASLTQEAEPLLLRGQSREQASQLSGRVEMWQQAIPVWEQSPLVGKGLVTASRFEVLEPLGLPTTSTIHSTWVEALVGTGIAGTALLAWLLVGVLVRATRDLAARTGYVYPGLVLTLITVRSLTGTTIELFGMTMLFVVILSYRLSIPASRPEQNLHRPIR